MVPEEKGRISASMAKRCSGNGNPLLIVKKLITIGNPTTKPRSQHMTYGIVNESIAVGKYLKQEQDSGQTDSNRVWSIHSS